MDTDPSTYVEVGWKPKESVLVADEHRVLSKLVENNQFPDFNQQLLLHSPKDAPDVSGFLDIALMVRRLPQDFNLGSITLPLEALKTFQPLHIEMILNQEEDNDALAQDRMSLFLQVTLEKPIQGSIDKLTYAVLKWASFKPLPSNVKRFAVALATESATKFAVPYVKLFTKKKDSVL